MKKFRLLNIIFLVLALLVSCKQYVYIPFPIFGQDGTSSITYNVDTEAELRSAAANALDGDRIHMDDISLDPSTEWTPIEIHTDVILYGTLNVETNETFASSLMKQATDTNSSGISIFNILDSSVTITGLSINVAENIAADISSIINVGSGSGITATSMTVSVAGNIAVTGIYISTGVSADNINISTSETVVEVDENNIEIDEILNGIDDTVSTPYDVSSADDFMTKIEEGRVRLMSDITLETALTLSENESYSVELNEKKLVYNTGSCFILPTNTELTMRNGSFTIGTISGNDEYGSKTSFSMGVGSILTLNQVDMTTESMGISLNTNDESATGAIVNIINNSSIFAKGAYGISTNANVSEGSLVTEYATVNVEDSVIIADSPFDEHPESIGIMFNIPGTLNIRNSSVTGDKIGVLVRGGIATIEENSIITTTGLFNIENEYFFDTDWSKGTAVAYAALVVGNRGSSYKYESSCTLSEDSIINTAGDAKTIYLASTDYNASLTCDSSYENEIRNGGYWGAKCYLNGNLLEDNTSN